MLIKSSYQELGASLHRAFIIILLLPRYDLNNNERCKTPNQNTKPSYRKLCMILSKAMHDLIESHVWSYWKLCMILSKAMHDLIKSYAWSYQKLQYGSGKRTNFFFHFADQFYNPRFSAEWFGVNHSEWKKFTRSYALDIPRTFSGPQCTHDIRSVCEYLRVATDCSVQVSLTTQIILSHNDNHTKIVTTAIIILTLVN